MVEMSSEKDQEHIYAVVEITVRHQTLSDQIL